MSKYIIAVTKHTARYYEVEAESQGEAIVKLSLLLSADKDPMRVESSIDHSVISVESQC